MYDGMETEQRSREYPWLDKEDYMVVVAHIACVDADRSRKRAVVRCGRKVTDHDGSVA
jgi:hypothetical protein